MNVHDILRAAFGSAVPVLLAGLLASACSSTPPAPPPIDSRQVDNWVMRGYLSETHRGIEFRQDRVEVAGETIDLQWQMPDRGSSLPWVIYLPGLGESERAGERWQRAWATAGYAVLAVAGGPDDELPPELVHPERKPAEGGSGGIQEQRKRLADQRDALHEWARQRYRPEVALSRLRRLAGVIATISARRAQGDPWLARVDTRRVALAGYDAGAYTVTLAAGEQPAADWNAPALPVPVAAVVALSPYADFGGTGFAQRYRAVRAPLLSVSGPADQDYAGVVPSPFVRRAPFENLTTSGALLWLQGMSHAVLAGAAPLGAVAATDESPGDAGRMAGSAPGPAGGGRGGGGGRGSGRGGGAQGPAAGRIAGSGDPVDERGALHPRSTTDEAIDQAIVAGTTTAFLDAQMKQDPVAREWLDKDAARWLGRRGEWRQRP